LFAQSRGGVFVGFAFFVEFHGIHRLGLLARVVAARDVVCDVPWVAFQRIAVTAAAGGRDAHRVAGGDVDVLVLGEVRRGVDFAIAGHADPVATAVGAAEHALRADAAVVHDERGTRAAAPQAHGVVDSEAAALAARAARALVQRVLLEQHRIELLQDLDRGGLGNADGRATVRDPVAGETAAVAAAGDRVHHVGALGARIVAAEREVAAGTGRGAEELFGDRLDQRGEHRLGDALADLGGAAGHRARVFGVQKGTFRVADVQRLEGAGVDRGEKRGQTTFSAKLLAESSDCSSTMPRRARLVLPNVPLHMIQRGNNRQACFFAEADYRRYLGWLAEYADKTGCQVHAYVLMANHVHLLVSADRAEAPGLLMKGLGQRYVQYVNRSYRRSGTLWEGRFRSCPTQEERYLLACQRYIELNPVRAKIVAHPAEYTWSSYRANAQGQVDTLLKPHPLFEALGSDSGDRQAAYRELFRDELEPGLVDEIRRATNGNFALGNDRFAAQVSSALGRRAMPGKPGRPRKVTGIRNTLSGTIRIVVCPRFPRFPNRCLTR